MTIIKRVVYKTFFLGILVAIHPMVFAQLYIEGEHLKVENSATLYIEGDIETAKNGSIIPSIRNLGNICVKGDVSFVADTEYKGQGQLCFTGSTEQSFIPNIPFKKLAIQNSNNVVLTGHLNLQGQITLTSGHLVLGNYNLMLDDSASLSGGSSSSYVRINGTGRLTAEVGNTPITFPVGRNPYEPVILDNGGGNAFSIGLSEAIYDNPENTSTGLISSNVVGETWTIQADQSASSVDVTLQWNAAEEETSFNRSNCVVSYWEDGVSTAWDQSGTVGSASGTGPYSRSRTINFTSNLFYLGVGDAGSALPVELTYFTAQWAQVSQVARLNWQTATEENNSHFTIERSFDGLSWTYAGRVEGFGTSISSHDYQFMDQLDLPSGHTLPSVIFYRLKQVDYNGDFEYSPIRTLENKMEMTNSFAVFPNPTSSGSIHFTKPGIYHLYNPTGQLLIKGQNEQKMDVSHLAAGVYMIKNEKGQSTRLVKL